MAGYLKRDIFSSEAGVKYFLFGALSTGVMLYGISLIYGMAGTLSLDTMFSDQFFKSAPGHQVVQLPVLLALTLVLVGLGFKCSLVPFHMWTPDVYEGAPTPVSALFSVGPKAVGFALILRIFVQYFVPMPLSIIAVLTMTIGNVIALSQNNIKRLLAYSTIAQAGYILVGLAIGNAAGIQATLFYLLVYTLMNLGAFGAAIAIFNSIKSDNLADYAGFYKRDPFTAVVLTVSLLSLAGIPPLAGFLAKFFILSAAVEAGSISLAIIIVLNSVIAFYYYIRIVKYMFLSEPNDKTVTASEKSPALQFALLLTMIANVVIGVWPHPVINWLASLLK
jgi:NADH-quinone oxidoreductase subunit N